MTLATAPRQPERDKCPVEKPEHQEVLLAEDLAPVIDHLVEEFTAGLTSDGVYVNGVIGPSSILGDTVMRGMNRIRTGENVVVSLDTADKLITTLGGNINLLLPPEAFYKRGDLVEAQRIHTELLITVARCRGEFVPPPGDARRAWPEMMRRKLHKEQRAA